MSYFDDPQHKAAWDKELAALKRQKEAMKSGAVFEAEESMLERNMADEKEEIFSAENEPYRVRITFEQLLDEENMNRQVTLNMPSKQKNMQKEVQLEH